MLHLDSTLPAHQIFNSLADLAEQYELEDDVWYRIASASRDQLSETSWDGTVDLEMIYDEMYDAKGDQDMLYVESLSESVSWSEIEADDELKLEVVNEYLLETRPGVQFKTDGHMGEGLYADEGLVYAVESVEDLRYAPGYQPGDAVYRITGTFFDRAAFDDSDLVEVESAEMIAIFE